MTMDRQRFVQQYVERQKAYIPTYTADDITNEHRKPPRSDLEFGFDTPVLRPRAPLKPQLTTQSKRAELESTSVTRDHAKEKPRNKREKGSAPIDTNNERTARLADRRERKRKKRAIVSPPKEDEENVRAARPRKGKANKPSAALALMYGFSATNVTKDRLTLKPAPSLGVFSKGKASTKKRVTATKKSASRNELFSESAFLNKPSERSDALSEIDDSDDGSTPNHSQETRVPNHTKKDRGKCTEAPALKRPSTRTTAESEIWDIEMQSKLPSSACDVSSDPETKESAPVMLDLRGAEWSGSIINVAGEHKRCRDKTRTRSLSVVQSGPRIESIMICSSPSAEPDLGGGLLATHAADVSSLHPSHSASQVGRRVADVQASDPLLVASKYFVEHKPVFKQEFILDPEPIIGLNDSMDMLGVEDQYVEDPELDVQTIHRAPSPMSSPRSVPPHTTEFRAQYDMGRQTNECPCEDCWIGANVPSELLGGSDLGYFTSAVVESQGDQLVDVDGAWDWHTGECEGDCEPLVPEYEYDVEAVESVGEPWEPCMDESIGWGGDDGADFLEGRALLRGVEGAGCVGPSGLDEVERDVASRLRNHWRPLRL